MKNSNTLANKFGEISHNPNAYADIIKLNKKIQSIDSLNEKIEKTINEEVILRQNIEKKTFQMNESLNSKINSLADKCKSSADSLTEQIDKLEVELLDTVKKTAIKTAESFDEWIKKLQIHQQTSNESLTELYSFRSEINSKIYHLDDKFQYEMKCVRKDIIDNNSKIDILDKKFSDNIISIREDLKNIIKDVNNIKNEFEMVKIFKENTVLNFKDISVEFIKNEESFNKLTNKITVKLNEFESKMALFEQTFNLQGDNFINIKKDIYAQIYDTNININNKFQLMNETLIEKIDTYDKRITNFENSLIENNEQFTIYITEQFDQHKNSLKKFNEFTHRDLDLIKNKSNNLEEMLKTLRSEFFHNLNEVEVFLMKKYEEIYKNQRIYSLSNNSNY